MSWISRAYGWLRMDLPGANSTTVRDLSLSVSRLPLSVMVHSCHVCVNWSRLRSSGFTPTLHSGSSPSPTRRRAGHIACTRTFGLHEIFKCAHLKFMVYRHKHAHNFRKSSHTSVGLAQARPNHLFVHFTLDVSRRGPLLAEKCPVQWVSLHNSRPIFKGDVLHWLFKLVCRNF